MNTVPHLLGSRGCGSVIVECAFALAGLPLEVEEVDYDLGSPTRDRLLAVNPLGQVPTMLLPDGQVLTESLAMLHFVQDSAPLAPLIPPTGDARRSEFYRWAVFLIAAVYPTFTYGDDPQKWVPDPAGAESLKASTNQHRQTLLLQLEAAAREPWFLGERISAIDLYLTAMSHWRPRTAWFNEHAPKIAAIAHRTTELAELRAILAAHFPGNA
jgi:GST-like protein